MGSIVLRVPLQQYGYLEVTGDTALEVLALAEQSLTTGLHEKGIEIEKVAVATSGLGAGTTIVSTPEMQQVAAPLPVASPPPPAVVTPPAAAGVRVCVHGERVQRTGNGAKGPWVGWFCPTPKGTPGQCAPQWN